MLTLSLLRAVLRDAWGPDTCDPVDLADWRPENPARGQCGVTALVVHDLLGGDLMLGEVYENGTRRGCHYWNRLPDGTEVDLTRGQFRPAEIVSAGVAVARPSRSPRRCRGQYELLRHRVLTRLDAAGSSDTHPTAATGTGSVTCPDGIEVRYTDAGTAIGPRPSGGAVSSTAVMPAPAPPLPCAGRTP